MAGRDLYIIQMDVTGEVKVGRSDNVEQRLKQLQTGCPYTLKLILHAPHQGMQEKHLHNILRRYRTRVNQGEWFAESCLGELPIPIYEKMREPALSDPDWWKAKV